MINKKAMGLRDLMPVALLVVVSVIAISVGAQILADIGSGQCESGYAWNSTVDACYLTNGSGFAGGAGMSIAANATTGGLLSLNQLSSWLPTIALVIAAAIVIGVLVFSFRA